MQDSYITVSGIGESEITEKRSRFVGICAAVSSQSEALDFIASFKQSHKAATHWVFAYKLRQDNLMRYSDDGEPQGTAGLPLLDALERRRIFDAVIVVTRYFGGTLLGTGGLVRAYSETAALTLENAGLLTMKMCAHYELCCDYAMYDRVLHMLCSLGAKVGESFFAERIKIEVTVMSTEKAEFESTVNELMRGCKALSLVEEKYAPVDSNARNR
ncbi:MAG: YigZ family protein [Oscillospiraceae bacterium]